MVNQALERGEKANFRHHQPLYAIQVSPILFYKGIGSRLWRAGTSIPVPPRDRILTAHNGRSTVSAAD